MIQRLCMIVLCLVAFSAAAVPGSAQAQKGYGDEWDGVWIWGPRPADVPGVEIDLARWLVRRPGGWDAALVHRVIGNAAVAGLDSVYWHLEDEHGRCLYPSDQSEQVLRWPNWGVDFGMVDHPRLAAAVAERCGLPLTLVARSAEVAAEARQRYPGLSVVMASELQGETLVPAVELEPEQAAAKWLATGPHHFRRTISVSGAAKSARLTITAQGRYTLFVDGQRIGHDSDWWRGETYDLTDLFDAGEHVIHVEVSPGDGLSGLLANLRWRDAAGEHQVVTDTSWQCRSAGRRTWREPAAVGFGGVGPRFRLKAPWQNARGSLSRGGRWAAELVGGVEAEATEQPEQADALVDGSLAEGMEWQAEKLPVTVTITLPQPTLLREVRVYGGSRGEQPPSADVQCPTAYRLQFRAGDAWQDLVVPVAGCPDPETDPCVHHHAFSPRRIGQLRLVVEDAPTADQRSQSRSALTNKRRVVIREVQMIKAYGE